MNLARSRQLQSRITMLGVGYPEDRYATLQYALQQRVQNDGLDYESMQQHGLSPGEVATASIIAADTNTTPLAIIEEAQATNRQLVDIANDRGMHAEALEIFLGLIYLDYTDDPVKEAHGHQRARSRVRCGEADAGDSAEALRDELLGIGRDGNSADLLALVRKSIAATAAQRGRTTALPLPAVRRSVPRGGVPRAVAASGRPRRSRPARRRRDARNDRPATAARRSSDPTYAARSFSRGRGDLPGARIDLLEQLRVPIFVITVDPASPPSAR